MSFLWYGFQTWTQYSKCGRIYVLYSILKLSTSICLKLRFIIPRTDIALLAAFLHRWLHLRSLSIHTPKQARSQRGGKGGSSPPTDTVSPLTRYQPPHQPSVSAHEVWVSATTTVGLYGVYGCPDRAAIRYSRGLQTFPVGGHINDFLRLGGPNVKMNSIYLNYGE